MALMLAACAAPDSRRGEPVGRMLSADEGRAQIARLIPGVADRAGWATDIYAALVALELPTTVENACAAIAVIGQESGFQADPAVPGLPAIARREIERQRERAGIPKLVLDAALALTSSNGKSYAERLDTVRTEGQLSEIYEDFIGRVPLGTTFLAGRNPVHTAGPMQVSVAFATEYAADRPYPYPVNGPLRHELFTRRGGVYFGIAHLLDYRAPYDRMIYRFADFNAGRYASRNAAFQNAVSTASGITLDLDGDLVVPGGDKAKPGSTEAAVRSLATRLDLGEGEIRRALEQEGRADFEQTRVYLRVFELAEQVGRRPLPRAVLPQIRLHSPKITRPLTTEWFARRVDERHQRCLARAV